jgi:exosortase B
MVVLFGPTFYDLSNTIWRSEEHGHAPIVLAVVAWMLWQKRDALTASPSECATNAWPWVLLGFGCLLYVVGRSQSIIIFEIGSLIPILTSVLALQRGWSAVRIAAFPILFLVFIVPLPGPVLDALTGPLKQSVSLIAETGLHGLGYPIARSGVVLSIGQYQLLVADACSGLNSMFSLSALGLLYLHLLQHASRWRNALIVVSILPIAFVANIIRVMILVLVTYHFGEDAGQGVIHGAAGMVLFGIALSLFFGLDGALGLLLDRRKAESV